MAIRRFFTVITEPKARSRRKEGRGGVSSTVLEATADWEGPPKP